VSTTSASPSRLERSPGRALGEPAHEPTDERYPVLASAPPARVQALLDRYGPRRPAAVFAVVLVAGYLLLAAATIAVGLLLVHVVLSVPGIRSADEELPHAFAAHRTDLFDGLSLAGSLVGDIPLLPLLVAIAAVLAAWHRRWRVAAFIVAVGLLELATYRVASLLVHRDRPDVPHLDDLPLAQSYPSGHVAASMAFFGVLFTASWRIGLACLPIVALIGFSRLYLAAHYLSDVVCAAVLGILCAAVVSRMLLQEEHRTSMWRRG